MRETHAVQRSFRGGRAALSIVALAGTAAATGCGGILDVPPPAGVQAASALQNRSGAIGMYTTAKNRLFGAIGGAENIVELGGLMTDEYVFAVRDIANIDARRTAKIGTYGERGNTALQGVLAGRSQLQTAERSIRQYGDPGDQWMRGEAYALVGYAELYLAETFCAGVPLSRWLPDGGVEYGGALSTDSLLAIAAAHFDTALTLADTSGVVKSLANLGLARARLDRGQFDAAKTAAAAVPTGFVYNAEIPTQYVGSGNDINMYSKPAYSNCTYFNPGDHEGGTGLGFVSANDPRLVFQTTTTKTCDYQFGNTTTPAYYLKPVKFGPTLIPIATGAEARLIQAEAALRAGQVPEWRDRLNALRDSAPQTYLLAASAMAPLTADSTTGASGTLQVDVMFRERAFWLFGTGTRLGDLRRLIRQYNRTAESVFPTGTYAGGTNATFTTYGADVSVTLPTAASGLVTDNPNYQGCTAPTTAG